MIKTVKIQCLSEALSPITHMQGVSGNESIISREPVRYGNAIRSVPVLSGNAIRHRMVREPGALHLIKTCGLEGKLSIDQANFLFNGGSLSEASPLDNMAKIAAMQQLLPLYRLLGGSLRNQVIGGSLLVMRGILICEENSDIIQAMLDIELPKERLRSAEDFIGKYQYTRGDAARRHDAAQICGIGNETSNAASNLMIYAGQTVLAGAIFYHGFILQNVSELEVGALLNALQEWDALGGTLGGYARIGHGRLGMCFTLDESMDAAGLVAAYRNHCDQNKVEIAEWLAGAFPVDNTGKKQKKSGKELVGEEMV
jgi:hypothetical protein